MTRAALFPLLFQASLQPKAAIWHRDRPLDESGTIQFLLSEINAVFDSLPGTADDVFQACEWLRADVLHAKGHITAVGETSLCDFIQIYVCIPGIGTGAATGRQSDSYDWVVRSMNDVQGGGITQEVEPHRIEAARQAASRIGINQANQIIAEWCELAFYVARKTSSLSDTCDHLLVAALSAVRGARAVGDDESAIRCLLSVANWAVHFAPARSTPMVADLEREYVSRALPARQLSQIGIALTTAMGAGTSRSSAEWARDVLDNYRAVLDGHELVQVLCATVESVEDADSMRGEIITAIDDYHAYMRAQSGNRTAARYGCERLFDILMPLLAPLYRNRRADYLTEVLGAWYGAANPRRHGGMLYVVLDAEGTRWFTESEVLTLPRPRVLDELLREQTSRMNEFLGTTVTVAGERDFPLEAPTRPGVPSEAKAERLHESMRDLYGLAATELSHERFADAKAMLVLPHMGVPFQTALHFAMGRTFPFAASLQEPSPDRQIKRAVIWLGGTFTDELEASVLTAFFEASGIDVEKVSGSQCSKARFLEIYQSETPDLIWVTAHGEYDHFEPHSVYISLSASNESVSVSELAEIALPQNSRRLLVLNICDGAAGAVLGGVLGLGLAQLVADRHQAVISHMWPVDQRISSVFAALLARELTNGVSFFDSYSKAVGLIRLGKEALIETMQAMPVDLSQLTERMANRQMESESIYFYGSPVFFE